MTRLGSPPLPADWSDLLDTKVEAARSRLLSIAELGDDLKELVKHPASPLSYVQLDISRARPHKSIIIAAKSDGNDELVAEPVDSLVDDFGDRAQCRVQLYHNAADGSFAWVKDSRVVRQFTNWARAFWKDEARDRAGFLWWHNQNLQWNLRHTVSTWMDSHPFVGAVLFRLEHEDAGTLEGRGEGLFLSRWGALLEQSLPKEALFIRRHADEFLAILPCALQETPQALATQTAWLRPDPESSGAGTQSKLTVGFTVARGGEKGLSAEVLARRAGRANPDRAIRPLQPSTLKEESGSAYGDPESKPGPSAASSGNRSQRSTQPFAAALQPRSSPAPAPHRARSRVFISYSHQDAEWLTRLQTHLRPLEREGALIWDDTRLKAGARWREEIRAALAETKVAILLVSADFLASEFIVTDELPPLLKAAEEDGATILPVIVSPCRFDRMESLSRFQAVNDPKRPLVKLRRNNREEVLDEVARAVEDALGR